MSSFIEVTTARDKKKILVNVNDISCVGVDDSGSGSSINYISSPDSVLFIIESYKEVKQLLAPQSPTSPTVVRRKEE